MIDHQKRSCSTQSNNNLAIIAPQTFERHKMLTIAPPAVFCVATATWSRNSNAPI